MNSLTIKLDTFEKIKDFAQKVVTFESDINLRRGSQYFDAKSILSVFVLLDMTKPVEVELISSDEEELIRFIDTMKVFK